MKTKVFNFFFSTRLTSVYFILLIISMGMGTFIESWYGINTARIWIYNAFWFELIFFLLGINFIGNIFRYKLLRKEKWAVLFMHLSFILILLGALITRYFGYEGVMPIREGETENVFLSEKTYLTIFADGEIDGVLRRKIIEDDFLLSENTNNKININDHFNGIPFSINFESFDEGVVEELVLDDEGDRYMKIVEASGGSRKDHYIKEGEVTSVHNILFTLNNPIPGAINIRSDKGLYFLNSPFDGDFMVMASQETGNVEKNVEAPLKLRSLYSLANLQFVIPEPPLRGNFDWIKVNSSDIQTQDLLKLKIESQGENQIVSLPGAKGIVNDMKMIRIGELDFYLKYGSIPIKLPFSIRLNDFIAEKYPGTEKSYSSFMSKVTVEDDSSFDYDIYMNNILNHGGYRFFQASFDPDEKGTVLSVNNDFWGTFITYLGYIFLYVSMMGIFFYGKTRFKNLSNGLKKLSSKGIPLAVFFIFIFSIELSAQDRTFSLESNFNYDSLIQVNKVSESHASKFGKILIQDLGGRMKPVNTFSSELIRKVSKRENYNDLNSDQMLISIMQTPVFWYNVPMIFLKRGNDSIRKIIGIRNNEKYASFVSFFDENGNYKIASQLEEAYRSSIPNQFQKDFIEVDRKVNLLYSALEGKILRFFPVPDNLNNKWVSYQELKDFNFKGRDSLYAYNILPLYFNSLRIAKEDGNYDQPEDLLNSLIGFQKKYGEKIIPSNQKIDAEILYNKVNIFERLFKYYLYVSLIFFVLVLVQIFKEARFLNLFIKSLKILTLILFISHTLGLIFRGYISGHAPWSDAYESMIYVAWATLFFGLIFGRRSDLTIACTTFVSSMILMIAHWNWLDPAIANLQPVLDSYWLMIHVAIIVASYGPFALGMIIGSVCLFLMILLNGKNKDKLKNKIKELTIINELSLTLGLILLTIGNFLGAMWANESWGRYWGWDPKETWALISIMVYAFVIHIRLIPGFRTSWLFNLLSVIAFSSILMTYFGVNFYLVGIHSYASGDKVITPNFIYYSLLVVFILGFLSYFRSKKFL